MTVKAIFPRYNMAADMVEILLIIIIKHYSTHLVCYPIGQYTLQPTLAAAKTFADVAGMCQLHYGLV